MIRRRSSNNSSSRRGMMIPTLLVVVVVAVVMSHNSNSNSNISALMVHGLSPITTTTTTTTQTTRNILPVKIGKPSIAYFLSTRSILSQESFSHPASTTRLFAADADADASNKDLDDDNDDDDAPSTTTSTSTSMSTTREWMGGGFDTSAMMKYIAAIVIQMSLFTLLFQGLDRLVLPAAAAVVVLPKNNVKVPFFFAVNVVVMYFLSLKSRIFNPLSNQRPQPATKEIIIIDNNDNDNDNDNAAASPPSNIIVPRKMPSWTPPGFVFPIVWLLLIGPLRAVTSAMIIQASAAAAAAAAAGGGAGAAAAAGGIYCTKPLLAFMLHLSIGDVWNTINNVERRYGTSVLGVMCVWISAAWAARQYYWVVPLAGKLLALKLIWLTVATSLIIRTWQLNPKQQQKEQQQQQQEQPNDGGKLSKQLAPLLPTKGDGEETKFDWFSGTN